MTSPPGAPVPHDRLLRADEVAELLSVPASWVRSHAHAGNLPVVRLGRYQRFDPAEVRAWLDSCRSGGGPRFRSYAPKAGS